MWRKELVPVALEGAKHAHWTTPEALETPLDPVGDIVHILNPFDPLVIQRKRLQTFFDYEHRFEAYVPKEKRRFGYFAQPVLVGEEIVAVLDLKTDRERRQALVAEMDLAAEGSARRAQETDRGGAAPLRALPARALRASATIRLAGHLAAGSLRSLARQPGVGPMQPRQHEQREGERRRHDHPRAEPARDAERGGDPARSRRSSAR